jgi:hypothetical protein
MSTTLITSPSSRIRFGFSRVDITPPVGIYQGLWGAARHETSTGIHRPLYGDVLVFGAVGDSGPNLIRAQLDLSMLAKSQFEDFRQALSEVSGLPAGQIEVTISHTHAAGRFLPDRLKMPGGDLILPYLLQVRNNLQKAFRQAMANYQEVLITYAVGRCSLATNRDYWDEAGGRYVCGFNPDEPADDTVNVARITSQSGRLLNVVVNYGCHPTTLAYQNTLISPDYIGAMREEVERVLTVSCVFLQGACGDLGPRDGLVGDTLVADRNGRQLAFAALSAFESMGPPATDFQYQGPVVSGATLGTWAHVPFTNDRLESVAKFAGSADTVALLIKPKPDRSALQAEMEQWLSRQRTADSHGEAMEARDFGAYAERIRRLLQRLTDFPDEKTYSVRYSTYRMGDAFWVTCSGEPYNLIQTELRRRHPSRIIFFSPLAGDPQISYILSVTRYGKGLYQEETSILAPGGLEILIEAISARIDELSTK